MRDKIKGALFYITATPIVGAIAFLLYFNGLFHLFLPFALVVTVALCVVVWKREGRKDKARIERMYAEGLLRSPVPKPAVIDYSVLPEIAAVIAQGDNAVVAAVTECTEDHFDYFENHRAEYAERGIESIETVLKEELCWSCVADQLTDNHYAVEIDWKTETEDILYNLDFIVKKLQFPIDLDSLGIDDRLNRIYMYLDDDDHITRFALREISSALELKGYALGQIEMDSDAYVLFLTEKNQRERLVALANRYGRAIWFHFS
jgi:hypothetical protein